MKDLEPELKEKVVALCQKGVEQAEIERFEASNRSYMKVFDLLPEPKSEWKAYTWLLASMADNYYELKQFSEAFKMFTDAVDLDHRYRENGFVRMRRGQCIYELDGEESAKQELQLAHKLGGDEVFEDEYVKYKKLAMKE